MNIFQQIIASLRYREAVRLADNAHRETGLRYYVIPSFGGRRQLIVVDRKNFRLFKHKHYINNNAYVNDLIRECFYCTPYRNGDGYLSSDDIQKKYRAFLSWWAAESRLKKLKANNRKSKD